MSPEARSNSRPYFLFARNYIWIAYKDYPVWSGLRFVSFRLAMMAYFALRTRHVSSFLNGVWEGVCGCRQIKRAPVNRSTLAYIDSLEIDRPNLLVRYARHRTVPQL